MSTTIFLDRCRELASAAGVTVEPPGTSPGPPPSPSGVDGTASADDRSQSSGAGISAPGTPPGTHPMAPPSIDAYQPPKTDAEFLIGFFQMFRPRGDQLLGLFDALPFGDDLGQRLQDIYQVTQDSRRPGGGRDAFFIVRSPEKLSVEATEAAAIDWLTGLRELARFVEASQVTQTLETLPKIRVLVGVPPKQPKKSHERSNLLRTLLEECPKMTPSISNIDPHGELLRRAYYFIACDAMLRDYLMWPFFASETGLADPFAGYFRLWSHGAKYRAYGEGQLDIYLPRDPTDD